MSSSKADVGFGVVSVGADGKLSSKNTHRITLRLAVTKRGGGKVDVFFSNGALREDEEQG